MFVSIVTSTSEQRCAADAVLHHVLDPRAVADPHLGFIRLAHAGGWGTRANAYSGSADDVNEADADLDHVSEVDDRKGEFEADHEFMPARAGSSGGVGLSLLDAIAVPVTTDTTTDTVRVTSAVKQRRASRIPNLRVALPYVIAFALIAGGVFYDVRPA